MAKPAKPPGGTTFPGTAETAGTTVAGPDQSESAGKTATARELTKGNEVRGERSLVSGFRDPFKALPPPAPPPRPGEIKIEGPLPPGPRGLVISQIRLEGIVRDEATHQMIAVVTGDKNLAYFLREKEEVFNGVVSKITPTAIYFVENYHDPDRGVRSHEVVVRLAPTPGEAK